MKRFDGATVLVTGGSRGQGAAEVRAFHGEGARVAILDVLDQAGEALAAELGGRTTFHHLDVSDEQRWAQVMGEIQSAHGPVSVLVNNAGILARSHILETSRASFQHVLDVNLVGALLGIQAVAPSMAARGGGAIVNISSVGGMQGNPDAVAYVSSKWALRGLSKAAASDLARYGIRVNCVLPGAIQTEMIASQSPDPAAWLEQNRARALVPRMGQPEDVAAAVLYLASADAGYLTGSEIVVDGGWTVR